MSGDQMRVRERARSVTTDPLLSLIVQFTATHPVTCSSCPPPAARRRPPRLVWRTRSCACSRKSPLPPACPTLTRLLSPYGGPQAVYNWPMWPEKLCSKPDGSIEIIETIRWSFEVSESHGHQVHVLSSRLVAGPAGPAGGDQRRADRVHNRKS